MWQSGLVASMEGASFLQFVRSKDLDLASRDVFHLFSRDGFLSLHQAQAQEIASLFFKTQRGSAQVVKREGELETLNVGKILAGRIAASLLLRNKRLVVWTRNSSAGQWEAQREASPGNYSSLIAELGQFFSKAMDESSESGNTQAVIACLHHSPSAARVGVAIAHTSLGLVQLYDFADDGEFSILENVLVQQGVREVVLAAERPAAEGPRQKKAKLAAAPTPASPSPPAGGGPLGWSRVFERTGVALTAVADALFKPRGGASSVVDDLAALLLLDGCSSRDADLAQARTMERAHPALAALLSHLDLRGPASAGTLRLEIGQPEAALAYDASLSLALSVFPEHGSSGGGVGGGGGGGASRFDVSDLQEPGEGWAARGDDEDLGAGGGGGGESSAASGSTNAGGGKPAGRAADSLFGLLNHSKTRMGGRLLRTWLQQPLRDVPAIRARHDVVGALLADSVARSRLRDGASHLARCPDLERTAHKFRVGSSSGGAPQQPKATLGDLLAVYRCGMRLKACAAALGTCVGASPESSSAEPAAAGAAGAATTAPAGPGAALAARMHRANRDLSKLLALVEELIDARSLAATAAGRGAAGLWGSRWIQVRAEFSADVLGPLSARLEGLQSSILAEHKRVAQVAGVDAKQLHLERSAVHGLHLRATKKDSAKILKALDKAGGDTLCRTLSAQKQGTLFLTAKLGRLVVSHEAARLEYDAAQQTVANKVLAVAATYFSVLLRASALLAELDCLCCLAHVASLWDWQRPEMVEGNSGSGVADGAQGLGRLHLIKLRHPLVEAIVGPSSYVSSDLDLRGGQRCAIITGPNVRRLFCSARCSLLCSPLLSSPLLFVANMPPPNHTHSSTHRWVAKAPTAVPWA